MRARYVFGMDVDTGERQELVKEKERGQTACDADAAETKDGGHEIADLSEECVTADERCEQDCDADGVEVDAGDDMRIEAEEEEEEEKKRKQSRETAEASEESIIENAQRQIESGKAGERIHMDAGTDGAETDAREDMRVDGEESEEEEQSSERADVSEGCSLDSVKKHAPSKTDGESVHEPASEDADAMDIELGRPCRYLCRTGVCE